MQAWAARPIIIDTDMGNDDWIAILYLLQSPEVAVKAILVTPNGSAHGRAGVKIAKQLLRLTHQQNIAVGLGRRLKSGPQFPADYRIAADNISGLSLPPISMKTALPSATELFKQVLQHTTSKVDVVALGPLTNIADAFKKYPTLKKRIARLYIMGGAVKVPGNIYVFDKSQANRVAEWNIYLDVKAAHKVFQSKIAMTLVPLDVTSRLPINMAFVRQWRDNAKSKVAVFIGDVFWQAREDIKAGDYQLWDLLAAMIVVQPSLVTTKPYHLKVVTKPGASYGKTQLVRSGPLIDVVVKVDRHLIYQTLLKRAT